MSQYADFFIRYGDEFINIMDYCRSGKVYEIIHDSVPYGKIKAFNSSEIGNFALIARDRIDDVKKSIEEYERTVRKVSNFNNSVSEKMEIIHDYESLIRECEEDIDDFKYAQHCFYMLQEMISAVFYTKNSKINPEKYIYIGIEISEPTIEDIEE